MMGIVIFLAEKLGWPWLASLFKPKQTTDPTPVAQAQELGQDQAKLQTKGQADAQVQTATVARSKAELGDVRNPASELRDDPFDLDSAKPSQSSKSSNTSQSGSDLSY